MPYFFWASDFESFTGLVLHILWCVSTCVSVRPVSPESVVIPLIAHSHFDGGKQTAGQHKSHAGQCKNRSRQWGEAFYHVKINLIRLWEYLPYRRDSEPEKENLSQHNEVAGWGSVFLVCTCKLLLLIKNKYEARMLTVSHCYHLLPINKSIGEHKHTLNAALRACTPVQV